MSVVQSDGVRVDLGPKQRLIDCILGYRRLIGHRRWGMVQLYYRAGLSQQEIADIFGINRQMVTYELQQAFRLVAKHLRGRRQEPTRLRPSE